MNTLAKNGHIEAYQALQAADQDQFATPRAHLDSGSMVTTTHDPS